MKTKKSDIPMIPVDAARDIIDERLRDRRVPSETIPVRQAAGRFLAVDQRSNVALPPFDKSAVDGFAVRDDFSGGELRLAGNVQAGESGTGPLAAGTTVKVMTGAPVPPGTGRVIMIEYATESNGVVSFDNPPASGNVSKKAEDVAAGDIILTAGSRIGAVEIANLIGSGVSTVEVARPVTVAVLATGDEIVDSPSDLTPGKIMNSNGPLMSHLAARYGMTVTHEDTVPDDLDRLTAALKTALEKCDMVVMSGGVSVGEFDFVPEAVAACGLEIHFSHVAIKPGKHITFATGENSIFIGLPGNPVSVYLMFQLYVLRAAGLLSGTLYEPKQFKLRL
ncbi:MAG: molybdopterin molybdotransferase MoeA, partial [Candidatus Latescibacterota bacterium]